MEHARIMAEERPKQESVFGSDQITRCKSLGLNFANLSLTNIIFLSSGTLVNRLEGGLRTTLLKSKLLKEPLK